MKRQLKFRDDDSFVIVQFSDIEMIDAEDWDPDTPKFDQETKETMEKIIKAEHPDFIVFAGDLIASARAKDPLQSFRKAVAAAEENQIPWAAVFGNHDSEGSVTRKEMHEEQLKHEYCVAEEDPLNISGAGNFILKVKDKQDNIGAVLYFLDSGVDGVNKNQVDWYRSNSHEITTQNGGQPIPSLAFFHIPLPEYNDAWNSQMCSGNKYEMISRPSINTGLFTAMSEMGDVMGTFVGHDHANDFCAVYKGIHLCYGRSTRYISYIDGKRDDHFPTGARVIKLKSGIRQFETWIRQNDGSVITS
ncbi:metallophosphoesterase family protein [Neobacillus kokaensis]|uniref:Metallophosphatase n=1 Tax=Neobacillus kokaensis TaxID=2759023 RepID=A0ABQ3N6Z5_9BACI|nr:metallophosphoesterase family protein [Neobacillus kokaensis]GHH99826.1 metallophosphatase [Neobacillus kokaensis]